MPRHLSVFCCRAALWLAVALFGSSAPAASATFPAQPLTLIIPGGPGGISDLLGKTMAQALTKTVNIPVQTANRPGGSGIKALEYFLTLPPNGYSVLLQIDTLASQFADCKINIDPTRDLTPIALVQITLSHLFIRQAGENRFQDWESFLAYARQRPQPLKIALFGRQGSMESLLLQMLSNNLGLALEGVHYERSTQRYLSLILNQTDALIEQPGDVRAYINGGLMQPILTLLPQPHQPHLELPRTPSFADLSGDYHMLYRFRGFFSHAATPPERLRYLERVFQLAFDSAIFQSYNRANYMNLLGSSYRDSASARALIAEAVSAYRQLLGRDTNCRQANGR